MEYQNFIKSIDIDIEKAPKSLKQYLDIKRQNPDCIIFFRLGDFYETYFEDAIVLSKTCGILLTKRKFVELGEIPMAGVPHHNSDIYISKLTNEKYKVSIVEQIERKEDVKKGEILKREVIRTYTKGTLIDESFLDSKKNNFIVSILKENNKYGLSYADISTGEFFITEGMLDNILCELSKINPSEMLLKMKARNIEPMKAVPEKEADIDKIISEKHNYTLIGEDFYTLEFQNEDLLEYKTGLKCANSIINYVKKTQKSFTPKLDIIKKYNISNYLIMNQKTRENLELNKNLGDGKKTGSIFWALDECKTSMGKRLLAAFLNEPLYNIFEIEKRLDGVEELVKNPDKLKNLDNLLDNLSDTSRLSSKLSNGTISPKELLAIKNTLNIVENFEDITSKFNSKILQPNSKNEALIDFRNILEKSIKDEPSGNIRVGNIIKEGANGTLDAILGEISKLENKIKNYEEELIQITGIKNLKINYAKNTGYSIDLTILDGVKFKNAIENSTLKQKLSSVEKYTTKTLMEIEEKLLSLKLKSYEIEHDTFLKLREYAKELTEPLREFSADVALKDVILSFAKVSLEYGFKRPKFTNSFKYKVSNGAHPSLIKLLANKNIQVDRLDVNFDDLKRCKILTGANMIGKSTYLRQIAALIIMAQTGSFVPAEDFEANLIDKIYARMGASDNMLDGNSAFMCEMLDVAEILRNSTEHSLILLDETGKSTSYSDAMAVSYGVIKYITEKIKAKCAFATHFHDMAHLEDEIKSIANYCLVLKNENEKSERRLKTGVSTKSQGLNVAKQAHLPTYAIECAQNFEEKRRKLELNK